MSLEQIALYTDCVGLKHRRSHGQFFTPLEVAHLMCEWVMEAGAKEVYDPAFGLGAFFKAARSIDPKISFRGTEIDQKILDFYQQTRSKSEKPKLSKGDYLAAWGQRHSAIVCNPPYMRFQLFSNRSKVFADLARNLDLELSGYTNIASTFLIKSLSELKSGGRLAYIMPLEFLNTGYGKIIKSRLLERGLLKALIRINPEKEVFPDATTSVGVVLAANDGVESPVKFYDVQKVSLLKGLLRSSPVRQVARKDLLPSDKWLKHFDQRSSDFSSPNLVTIDTYGAFSRGIATGANEFFAMSKSAAEDKKLSRSLFLSCITKSAQITKSVFTEQDLRELESSDAPVLLLNLTGSIKGAADKYLKYGESCGYHQRYLTKSRTPWYKLEKRSPAPLLFGVFSRERFKVIRNLSSAINLTCFHGFYPNLFGHANIDALFLYFQSRAARRLLELNMRRYGDALDKFEPNDLNRALAPSAQWLASLPRDSVAKALKLCRQGNPLPDFMDELFDQLISQP